MRNRSLSQPSDLWAITAYFNPLHYRSRLCNYRVFRKKLNAPLITVELAYGNGPELKPGDADRLIQIPGRDVLWQKERLLNLAINEIPRSCRAIAWLDCDIVFEDPDWALKAQRKLLRYKLIQAFQTVKMLGVVGIGKSSSSARYDSRDSLAARMCEESIPLDVFRSQGASQEYLYAPGHAWVGRTDILLKHGLYDAMIMGSGDKAIAAAAYGRHLDAVEAFRMNNAMARHYLTWAIPFHKDVQGSVGFTELGISHLWHGELKKRRYSSRYQGFDNFDPSLDLAAEAEGPWRWNTDNTKLLNQVKAYFEGRDEDGVCSNTC